MCKCTCTISNSPLANQNPYILISCLDTACDIKSGTELIWPAFEAGFLNKYALVLASSVNQLFATKTSTVFTLGELNILAILSHQTQERSDYILKWNRSCQNPINFLFLRTISIHHQADRWQEFKKPIHEEYLTMCNEIPETIFNEIVWLTVKGFYISIWVRFRFNYDSAKNLISNFNFWQLVYS